MKHNKIKEYLKQLAQLKYLEPSIIQTYRRTFPFEEATFTLSSIPLSRDGSPLFRKSSTDIVSGPIASGYKLSTCKFQNNNKRVFFFFYINSITEFIFWLNLFIDSKYKKIRNTMAKHKPLCYPSWYAIQEAEQESEPDSKTIKYPVKVDLNGI